MSASAFEKLAALTRKKCETCPTTAKHRCCDRVFCQLVQDGMPAGVAELYHFDEAAEVPFMGPGGCRVSPEHRAFCTAFICPPHLEDRTFRREYERLCAKADMPAVPRGMHKAALNFFRGG